MYKKIRDKFTLDKNFNLIISSFGSEKDDVTKSEWCKAEEPYEEGIYCAL